MRTWEVATDAPMLAPGDVHVWRIALDQGERIVADLARTLARDELERADRLRYPRGRERFIVGRGTLRAVLGRYLDRAPESLEFRYGAHGKPALADGGALEFNLAHTADCALLAVARGRRLGIDVEAIRPLDDGVSIVRRYFSERECMAYFALPKSRRASAFFHVWTCKEAFIKATGEGLTRGLDRFDVSVAPDEPPRLLHVAGEPDEAARWSLLGVDPGPGFRAAVAVEGPIGRFRGFLADGLSWGDVSEIARFPRKSIEPGPRA